MDSLEVRRENVMEAFGYNGGIRQPFFLLDDVYASGETVKEVLRVLENHNMRPEFCLFLPIEKWILFSDIKGSWPVFKEVWYWPSPSKKPKRSRILRDKKVYLGKERKMLKKNYSPEAKLSGSQSSGKWRFTVNKVSLYKKRFVRLGFQVRHTLSGVRNILLLCLLSGSTINSTNIFL